MDNLNWIDRFNNNLPFLFEPNHLCYPNRIETDPVDRI